MRKGLTLLEVAVAAIVLGLCIGLVILAQSFLFSASIKNFVRDFQSYDIAVENFYAKYKQLPGDSNILTPGGNANGKIRGDIRPKVNAFFGEVAESGVPICGQEQCLEPMFFWYHLSKLGILNRSYGYDYTNNMKPEYNVPNLTIGTYQDGVSVGYNDEDSGSHGPRGNFYDIKGSNQIELVEVMAIEAKLDDGVPSTGFIRALDNNDSDCTIDSVGELCAAIYMTIGGKRGVNN